LITVLADSARDIGRVAPTVAVIVVRVVIAVVSFMFLSLLPVVMGFGSYDESEQENHGIDIDERDGRHEDGTRTGTAHEGEIHFEYDDASGEDLLEAYQEFRDR
jgi:hypothetical protein